MAAATRSTAATSARALKPGWVCDSSVCVGGADVCKPATCSPAEGARYCGKVGDGCGRALDCGDTCASLKAGWVCDTAKHTCVGGADCKKLACDGTPNARYCGKVGDGCGGTVDCGDTCSAFKAGWVCDTSKGLCVGGPSCARVACTVAGGGQYCGDIGDGCGGTLQCGDCPGSGTCASNVCPVASCGAMCAAQVKCTKRHDQRQRHGLRSRGQGSALQRHRLRARRGPGPRLPRAPRARPARPRCRANRIATALTDSQREVQARQRPGGRRLPAGHAGRQVAPPGDHQGLRGQPVRHGGHRGRNQRPGTSPAAAAQQERGQPAQDRHHRPAMPTACSACSPAWASIPPSSPIPTEPARSTSTRTTTRPKGPPPTTAASTAAPSGPPPTACGTTST